MATVLQRSVLTVRCKILKDGAFYLLCTHFAFTKYLYLTNTKPQNIFPTTSSRKPHFHLESPRSD
jgi:hypothetical protein